MIYDTLSFPKDRLWTADGLIVDNARILCGSGSTNVRNGRASVRPSVRLSRRSTAVAMCGGFAAGRRSEGSIGSGERRHPAATAAFSGKCGQCHVDSRVIKQVSNKCIAVRKVATPLRELTCHVGSHSVTCHPAEVTFPPLPQPKLVLD